MGERLTGADAAWLHMDRPTNRMVVNLVVRFDRTPDWEALTEAVGDRVVRAYPRFRQRVAEPTGPLALLTGPLTRLAGPQWVEDESFLLDDHLVRATLDEPGDDAALHAYVEHHAEQALPTGRPLWQLHLLDGYRGGGALLLRAAHAIGDGTALMHVVLALADDDPHREEQGSAAMTAPPTDEPSGPSGTEAVRASAMDWATRFPRALLGERHQLGAAAARVGSLAKLAVVRQDRRTVLREPLGTAKRVTWTRAAPLDEVRAVAAAHAATVNDVLLSVTGAALGTYLREHGSDVDEIGAMLPFNLRPLDRPMSRRLGNKFGLVYPDLPVGEMPLPDRVAVVHRTMQRIKLARQANVVFGWVSSVGTTPQQVENILIDRYAGMSSVIITNVPGPKRAITIAGAPVADLLFWVPTSGPVGVGLSYVSYAGTITIGIMVDAQLVPDVDRLRELLDDELTALGTDQA